MERNIKTNIADAKDSVDKVEEEIWMDKKERADENRILDARLEAIEKMLGKKKRKPREDDEEELEDEEEQTLVFVTNKQFEDLEDLVNSNKRDISRLKKKVGSLGKIQNNKFVQQPKNEGSQENEKEEDTKEHVGEEAQEAVDVATQE